MSDGPSIIERQAIGRLIESLKKLTPNEWHLFNAPAIGWKNYLDSKFQMWNPIPYSDLSHEDFLMTMRDIVPVGAKWSIIIRTIYDGFNYHHDIRALKETIITLIQSKVCSASEYYALTFIFNTLLLFKDTCININSIKLSGWGNANCKTCIIDFGYHGSVEIFIYPTTNNIDILFPFPLLESRFHQQLDHYVMDFYSRKTLSQINIKLTDEFAKQELASIYSNATCSFGIVREKDSLAIAYRNLEYVF